MKDQLLNKLLKYVDGMEDFLVKETPEYIKQLLEFSAYDAQLTMYICLGVLALSIVLFVASILLESNTDLELAGISQAMAVVVSIVFCITILVVPCKIRTIKKIQMAPKVFIIDYIRRYK